LVFDRERPGVGKGGAAAQPEVLDGEKKFPERKHFRILAPRRQQEIDGEDNQIRRQNAQGAPGEESSELDGLTTRERREQLSTNEVTAQNEEEIDADPAEAIEAAGRFESEERGVIDGDDDDGQRAEKIEARLALTMCETRVDFGR